MVLFNLTGQTIGDASVAGANVVLGDSSGLTTLTSTALDVINVDSSVIDNVDLGRSSGTGGTGLLTSSSDNLTIRNSAASWRFTGVNVTSGTNVDVLGNSLTGATGVALQMSGVSAADISSNDFTNSARGMLLSNMTGLAVGSGVGLNTVPGLAVELVNVTNATVSNLDLSFTGPSRSGTGLAVRGTTSSNITVSGINVQNRITGINLTAGSNLSVGCSRIWNNTTGVLAGEPGTNPNNPTGVVLTRNWFNGNGRAIDNPDRTGGTPPATIPDPQQVNAENNYWNGASARATSAAPATRTSATSTPCRSSPTSRPASRPTSATPRPPTRQPAPTTAPTTPTPAHAGHQRDRETDGQPGAAATGDGADEDGVNAGQLVVGGTATVTVNVQRRPAAARLDAWIDFDGDGDWNDAGEQVLRLRGGGQRRQHAFVHRPRDGDGRPDLRPLPAEHRRRPGHHRRGRRRRGRGLRRHRRGQLRPRRGRR